MLEAPRGIIASSNVLHRSCLPRHPPYALASNTTPRQSCMAARFLLARFARRQIITLKMITKRSISKPNSMKSSIRNRDTAKQRFKNSCFARVHYPVLKPPRTATPSHRHTAQAPRHDGHRIAPGKKPWGGDPGAQKRIHTTPGTHRTTGRAKPTIVFHTSNPAAIAPLRRAGRTPSDEHPTEFSVERR